MPAWTLFGGDPCSSSAWYQATVDAALPAGGEAVFVQVTSGEGEIAVFPMLRQGPALSALTTPYTVLWQPLLAPGLDDEALREVGEAFGRFCKAWGTIRLDAIDEGQGWCAPVAAGLRRAGLRVLPFDHFGNWHADLGGLDWPGYLAARPGALREAIRRRGRRLMQGEGAILDVAEGPAGVEAAIAAFETVYARSWKQPEPYPEFNAALARACAADGTLRLGVLSLKGDVLAAQLWVLCEGTATVFKLAHDEAFRAHSPGTVLTALMIQHLMERDGAAALDFGRGDDAYKQLWCDRRRQRVGWILANPLRPAGLAAIATHWAAAARRRLRAVTSEPPIPRSVAPSQGEEQ